MTDWTDPDWLAEAHAWIEAQVHVTGPTEQVHLRPWSTVLRAPTEDGNLYFKANDPTLRHEAALVELMAARRPDCVPPLVAADHARGWLLMTDAGTRLRDIVTRERDLSCWLEIFPLYARVQLDTADDVEAMVAVGVPDLRLTKLPAAFAGLLGDVPSLVADEPRLEGSVERVAAMCDELAAFGLPETIQHDDFHDGQVYVRDGRYLLLDWGDACVSHPFFTLSVTLEGVLQWGLDDVEGSVDVAPFRDAYLAAFGSPEKLVRAAEIALRLGWICRAINARQSWTEPAGTPTHLRMFLDGRPGD